MAKKSPDMNSIENLWKLVKKSSREKRRKNLSEMKVFAKEEWTYLSIKTS